MDCPYQVAGPPRGHIELFAYHGILRTWHCHSAAAGKKDKFNTKACNGAAPKGLD